MSHKMSHKMFTITAGIVFIIRIGASGFLWVEHKDQTNLSRMGHVALSNIIMIVQSGCLTYTFLNNKGSISTWSAHQIFLFLSLAVDTVFRVYMFLWCFSNSCCYCRSRVTCSQRDRRQPHPHFDQAVQESYTEFYPDIYPQCIVPQVKHFVGHEYISCEPAASSQTEEPCSIFVTAKQESRFVEPEEYVNCPEQQIPQSLRIEKKTEVVV